VVEAHRGRAVIDVPDVLDERRQVLMVGAEARLADVATDRPDPRHLGHRQVGIAQLREQLMQPCLGLGLLTGRLP
jgi:hypothetical protein